MAAWMPGPISYDFTTKLHQKNNRRKQHQSDVQLFERLASLVSVGLNWGLPWNPLDHHCTILLRVLESPHYAERRQSLGQRIELFPVWYHHCSCSFSSVCSFHDRCFPSWVCSASFSMFNFAGCYFSHLSMFNYLFEIYIPHLLISDFFNRNLKTNATYLCKFFDENLRKLIEAMRHHVICLPKIFYSSI